MKLILCNLDALFAQLEPGPALTEALHYLSLHPAVSEAWVSLHGEGRPPEPGGCEVRLHWLFQGRHTCMDTPACASVAFY
jgi:hypothetical protein